VAWGRKTIREYGATGRWEFADAEIDHGTLIVTTPYYDKDSNRSSGPATGLCVMFTEYAKANGLDAIEIHASNYAPLIYAQAKATETWSHVYAEWACHSEG